MTGIQTGEPDLTRKACSNTSIASRLLRLAATVMLSATASKAIAADEESRAGSAVVSVSYQYQTADSIQVTTGEVYIGPVDTHSINLDVAYFLTDRWTLHAGIPYIRRRYQGTNQHDPLLLDPPRPYIENVDQGDWNSSFQDFFFGASYLAFDSPTFTIEPHVFLGLPSHDYPFFGNAAVGQNQSRIEIGSSFTFSPGLSDAYYGLNISYAFVEQVLNTNINHLRINAEAGYFFTPRLNGRAFVLVKEGQGLDFPDDFPGAPADEQWYQHDRLVKHNYVIVGIGADWVVSDKYEVSAALMKMTHAEMIHVMDYSFDITVSRAF
jgi:hypothetical protein